MRIKIFGFILFVSYPLLGAQNAPTPRVNDAPRYLIAVGATRDDVRKNLGMPQMLYSVNFQKYFAIQQESFLRDGDDRVADVYEQAGKNAMRVTVLYSWDVSASRLHPPERVIRVDFMPDQQSTYLPLLRQIPEVVALCQSGCILEGQLLADEPSVLACRTPKSGDEMLIMKGAATGWSSVSADSYEWCARITFSDTFILPRGKHPQVPWESFTVDKISVGPALRPSLQHPASFDYADRIGTWTSGQ